MHYYPHHIGDYKRDTGRLTILQHGAYRLLMDEYYWSEKPLPGDPDSLWRICSAMSKAERLAVSYVAERFFAVSPEGLRQKRIDAEIVEYQESANRSRGNGKNGGRPRKQKPDPLPEETQKKPTGFPEKTHTGSGSGYTQDGIGSAEGKGTDWPEKILNAYPRTDAPMECVGFIQSALDSGEDPRVMWEQVRECAAYMGTAPQGHANSLFPGAKTFFSEKRWRQPEVVKAKAESLRAAVTKGQGSPRIGERKPGETRAF